MEIDVKKIEYEESSIFIKNNTIYMEGIINITSSDKELKMFWDKVGDEMIDKKIYSITINMFELKFMNSICIKIMANWLNRLKQNNSRNNYSITFICNNGELWQESSVATLQFIIPNSIHKVFI